MIRPIKIKYLKKNDKFEDELILKDLGKIFDFISSNEFVFIEEIKIIKTWRKILTPFFFIQFFWNDWI